MQSNITPIGSTQIGGATAQFFQVDQDQETMVLLIENPETKEEATAVINLAKDGHKIVFPESSTGDTWLHFAALHGLDALVLGFIQKGGTKLDIDIRNEDDETPLMLAAKAGKKNSVEILIKHKADLNAIRRFSGWSVLHVAALAGEAEITELLLQKGARIIETTSTLCLGKIDFLEGCSPLFPAVYSGDESLVRALIKAGDNPHRVLERGENVLHYAASGNNLPICEILLEEFKVNPNQKNNMLNTPFNDLSMWRKPDILACFLENGADIDIPSRDKSFLMVSCLHGEIQTITILLNHSANPNQLNEQGITAFMVFLDHLRSPQNHKIDEEQVLRVIKLFIEKGVKVTAFHSRYIFYRYPSGQLEKLLKANVVYDEYDKKIMARESWCNIF